MRWAVRSWLARVGVVATVAAAVYGCSGTGSTKLGVWDGLDRAAQMEAGQWAWNTEQGVVLESEHYRIHTTVSDPSYRATLTQVMEGAYEQYRRLAPDVPETSRPMDAYIFAQRSQWADYTVKTNRPEESRIYLQINRGGYAIRDQYVAYFIGEEATWSVASHEGWHQYVSRHFIGRIPPFLEEGLACMFERVVWKGGLPRWNLSVNPQRAQALRKAIESKSLFPLEQLVQMHAGQVVDKTGQRINAFYAQSWAFARFMHEKHRPALARLLADAARGKVYDPSRSHTRAGLPWNPGGVKPMLEHYLAMPWPQIETEYRAWIRHVAYEEFTAHFAR